LLVYVYSFFVFSQFLAGVVLLYHSQAMQQKM